MSPEFLPPDSAYAAPAWALPAEDPLVTPPGVGVNGWFQRIGGTLKRSWKSLVLVFAITFLLPTVVLAVAGVLAAATFLVPFQKELMDASGAGREPHFQFDIKITAGVVVIGVVVVIALLFLQFAGYAAAAHTTTREAAGLPVTLGESLGYGFRRCAGLLGWNLVTILLIMLGTLACLLPGIYVAAATALVGPVYLFERQRPIARSFEIFHRNLGRILGRLALVVVIFYGGSIVIGIVQGIANAALGSTDPTVALPGAIGVSVFGAILRLPLTIFLIIGILLTYAEQRGHEAPATSASLAAEL
jgi:hypothetical protein